MKSFYFLGCFSGISKYLRSQLSWGKRPGRPGWKTFIIKALSEVIKKPSSFSPQRTQYSQTVKHFGNYLYSPRVSKALPWISAVMLTPIYRGSVSSGGPKLAPHFITEGTPAKQRRRALSASLGCATRTPAPTESPSSSPLKSTRWPPFLSQQIWCGWFALRTFFNLRGSGAEFPHWERESFQDALYRISSFTLRKGSRGPFRAGKNEPVREGRREAA